MKAINESPLLKSPGTDGIPLEFYVRMAKLKGGDDMASSNIIKFMHTTFLQCYDNRILTPTMRQIQIRFIFKKQTEAQRMDPMNYRPISLLNTDYKILSKALANRLTPCLDDLLDDVQHCIPGMCISDPLRTVQSIIHQCKSLKQPGAIMLCDFEKAFDSVSHDYVKELMHAMTISTSRDEK